jgi:hypothetical protein
LLLDLDSQSGQKVPKNLAKKLSLFFPDQETPVIILSAFIETQNSQGLIFALKVDGSTSAVQSLSSVYGPALPFSLQI